MKTTHTIHPYLSQRLISRPCDLALTADVPRVIPSLSCNHPKKKHLVGGFNPLKMLVSWYYHSLYIYGKIKMFQTTNQTWKSSPTKNSQIISDCM